MAVRSSGVGSPGGAAKTVLGALVGIVTASSAVVASQPWYSEPTASVVIESTAPPGGIASADDAHRKFAADGGATDSPAAYDSDPVAWDDFCGNGDGAGCDPRGQPSLIDHAGRDCHDKPACWIGRADALLLWRNAPPGGSLVDNPLVAGSALSAGDMNSSPAAGGRFSIIRVDNSTGHAIEATYLRAANFRSSRPLELLDTAYELAPPGIYGHPGLTFDTANANLGARVQSFEFSRHHSFDPCVRFLAGFRWIEWQEQFSMQAYSLGGVNDFFQTNCINNLYGGQIGLDANLLSTRWVRFDSVVKAGAYYNNAVQSSLYTTNDPANPGTAAVTVGQSPLNCTFVGEVGLTGVIALTRRLDLRFGYFGLWLSGIAQPTRQLASQQLTPGQPTVGAVNSNGDAILQGVSLGLEGRW